MGDGRLGLPVVEESGGQVRLAGCGLEHWLRLCARFGQQPAFTPPFGHPPTNLVGAVECSLPAIIGRLDLRRE